MYDDIPLRHVPMNQEICRFFRSVWDPAVFMEWHEAAEITQYPVGSTPQLVNSFRGKGRRTIGKREEKGRSWFFGTRNFHGPFVSNNYAACV
jgi:hypothetical protein